jgi:NAD(P)H-flavin reductase
MKLEKPTVGEVVKLLQTLPQEAPFRINNSDTYWGQEIIHIKIDRNGRVWFCGEMRK